MSVDIYYLMSRPQLLEYKKRNIKKIIAVQNNLCTSNLQLTFHSKKTQKINKQVNLSTINSPTVATVNGTKWSTRLFYIAAKYSTRVTILLHPKLAWWSLSLAKANCWTAVCGCLTLAQPPPLARACQIIQ